MNITRRVPTPLQETGLKSVGHLPTPALPEYFQSCSVGIPDMTPVQAVREVVRGWDR